MEEWQRDICKVDARLDHGNTSDAWTGVDEDNVPIGIGPSMLFLQLSDIFSSLVFAYGRNNSNNLVDIPH